MNAASFTSISTKGHLSDPMRWGLLILGWLFFGLGFLGIFLPLLPTTGFWILAAILFTQSHPRMAAYLREHPTFGPGIRDFLDHGVIRRRGKLFAIGGMMTGGGISLYALWGSWWLCLLAIVLIAVGAIYVATRPEEP